MFCRNCGNQIPDYAPFCDKCGAKVEGSAPAAKPKSNKKIFIPIGIGALAVVLAVTLIVALRPKNNDITPPPDSGVQSTAPASPGTPAGGNQGGNQGGAVINDPVTPSDPVNNIPDELSFTINGDKLSVAEAGYCDMTSMSDGKDMNGLVLWGMNDKYIAIAAVAIKHEFTKANAVYYNNGSSVEDIATLSLEIEIYDKQSERGGCSFYERGDQIDKIHPTIKTGAFEPLKFINFSFAGTLYEDGEKFEISLGGRFDYCDLDEWLDMSYRFVDAEYSWKSSNPEPTPDPEPMNEVTIAGESYPLDTDYIDLTGKNVTNADIENLKYLTNLTNIQLSNNSRVTDLSALRGLTKLEILWLDDTGISDLSPLSGCKNLKKLGIKNTKVKDISVLSNFTKLDQLVAVNCNISDISPIANCPYMYEIWLSNNPITDFSPLVGLEDLHIVGLDNCCVMTWDILKTLYGLYFTGELKLEGNGITAEMAEALSHNLYSPGGSGQWYC